jgi:hypothetical protein
MSICFNPFAVQTIDLDECIGLSLATINTNYQQLLQENTATCEELDLISNNLANLYTRYESLTSQRRGMAKATVAFDGTGTATPSVYSSFNIARVLRRSTGVFELSYLSAFPNANYALIGTSMLTATSATNFSWVQPTTAFATTSATINIRDLSGTFVNPEYVSIAVYSNQNMFL